jgi:hypothetical protein
MRVPLWLPAALLLATVSGCVALDGDEKPTYASDNAFTRPWATCLVANAEVMDDGTSDAWTVAQAVAEECAPDLLSAFRRETNEKDRRKAYALTAEKAEALVISNRRDRQEAVAGSTPSF